MNYIRYIAIAIASGLDIIHIIQHCYEKNQYMNVLLHTHFILYTHNNEYILNALLQFIKF